MKAIQIFEDLKGRDQLTIESDHHGDIPQLRIALSDVENAIKESGGNIDSDYINNYGFLSSVYMFAAYRLGVDTSEFDNGPFFVEFA